MISPPKKRKPRYPFVVAYKAVLKKKGLSFAAKTLFHLIKSYANSDGSHCFPSLDRIAEDAECSVRTVSRLIRELAKHGLLHCERRRTKGGSLSSNTFLLYDENHAKLHYKPRKPRAKNGGWDTSRMACGEDSKIVDITLESRAAL